MSVYCPLNTDSHSFTQLNKFTFGILLVANKYQYIPYCVKLFRYEKNH
jgi:hypothetical protein